MSLSSEISSSAAGNSLWIPGEHDRAVLGVEAQHKHTVVVSGKGEILVSRKLVEFRLSPADFGRDCVGIDGPSEGFTFSIPVGDGFPDVVYRVGPRYQTPHTVQAITGRSYLRHQPTRRSGPPNGLRPTTTPAEPAKQAQHLPTGFPVRRTACLSVLSRWAYCSGFPYRPLAAAAASG